MVREGDMTGFYMQKELVAKVDQALIENPEIFKSRNNFINSAIVRELRRLNIN